MPFIDVRTSGELTPETEREIKTEIGKALPLIPGKAESGLMLQFTDHCRLWFGGEQNGTIVMVNVMSFGHAPRENYEPFAKQVVSVLEQKLNAEKVYLKIEEVDYWFWN